MTCVLLKGSKPGDFSKGERRCWDCAAGRKCSLWTLLGLRIWCESREHSARVTDQVSRPQLHHKTHSCVDSYFRAGGMGELGVWRRQASPNPVCADWKHCYLYLTLFHSHKGHRMCYTASLKSRKHSIPGPPFSLGYSDRPQQKWWSVKPPIHRRWVSDS